MMRRLKIIEIIDIYMGSGGGSGQKYIEIIINWAWL